MYGTPFFGNQTKRVFDSGLSHWMHRLFRIPNAIIGAWACLADMVFALSRCIRRWQFSPWIVILFGINVIPLGIDSILFVLEQAFVVKFWCTHCLVTAISSFILIILAYEEILCCTIYLYQVWRRSKKFSILWKTFCGKPSQIAHEVGLELTKNARQKKVE